MDTVCLSIYLDFFDLCHHYVAFSVQVLDMFYYIYIYIFLSEYKQYYIFNFSVHMFSVNIEKYN